MVKVGRSGSNSPERPLCSPLNLHPRMCSLLRRVEMKLPCDCPANGKTVEVKTKRKYHSVISTSLLAKAHDSALGDRIEPHVNQILSDFGKDGDPDKVEDGSSSSSSSSSDTDAALRSHHSTPARRKRWDVPRKRRRRWDVTGDDWSTSKCSRFGLDAAISNQADSRWSESEEHSGTDVEAGAIAGAHIETESSRDLKRQQGASEEVDKLAKYGIKQDVAGDVRCALFRTWNSLCTCR